ncbi:mitotic checkpoint serine/threonine-protein kinase BUB1 [Impatiens glandulifera]|uniref:mitotic checkpoint serine/threonine-protein kinase BUB1 n=1 Tax=Impatiens glandulifera TaxID=253017 RepID=UPI001FB1751A|nr:mitotic checkpoint serine/threonine-protein kinase BUB1 [Impatiens glandulifera]
MPVLHGVEEQNATIDDPILPYLREIAKAVEELDLRNSDAGKQLDELIINCITKFKNDPRYREDARFLKIWFLYMDSCSDSETVFREMEQLKICLQNSLLYENYALLLEANGKLIDAFRVYQLGISRNAKPVERLMKAVALFRDRLSGIINACAVKKIGDDDSSDGGYINPWSPSVINEFLLKRKSSIIKYDGYHQSSKVYSGRVPLSTLQKASRNKVIEIGGKKYQIKGCAGQGGFAQVFKAYINSNPDEIVALKIQKPAFSWEFYMYRLLDERIPEPDRTTFGYAHRLHLYSDYSILVCDYLGHGTLQDAINSNVVIGVSMDEVLVIYYTIELLFMLETLHGVGIIHGDFKPDNLLIRYSRDNLTVSIDEFRHRSGPWRDQGLSLVDWGRGIDMNLFPDGVKFSGGCRTSGFRCVEMQENKPWTFQVDTYGLCVMVHMMLHGSYMEIEKKESPGGGYFYQPKIPFKRYWLPLWKEMFKKLLNMNPDEDEKIVLKSFRESLQDYICSDSKRISNLKQSLLKQRNAVCSG